MTIRPSFFNTIAVLGWVFLGESRGQTSPLTGTEEQAAQVIQLARQVHPTGRALTERDAREGIAAVPPVSRRLKVLLAELPSAGASDRARRILEAQAEWTLLEAEELAARGQYDEAVRRLDRIKTRGLPRTVKETLAARRALYAQTAAKPPPE